MLGLGVLAGEGAWTSGGAGVTPSSDAKGSAGGAGLDGRSSEKSMSRSSSGSCFGGGGGGGWALGKRDCVGLDMVVTRVRFVVSSEGGGGRAARTDARQRNVSPLPK